MADLTYAQLKGTWLTASKGTRYHSNAWASLMAAIAEAESQGDPLATNPNDTNGKGGSQTSWGLWQISNGDHSQPSTAWSDPVTNAKLAIGKLNTQGLTAWGTYNSGAYKGYLSDKTTADLTAATGPSAVETAATTAAAGQAADCLWPPSAKITIPIIPGVYHQSFDIPCLLSRSEARALIGAGLLLVGAQVAGLGVAWILKATAITALAGVAGVAGRLAGPVAGGVTKVASKLPGGVPA